MYPFRVDLEKNSHFFPVIVFYPPPKIVEEEGAARDKPKENCIGTGPASTENPSASGGRSPPDPLLVFFT